jgi:hypothetical protein
MRLSEAISFEDVLAAIEPIDDLDGVKLYMNGDLFDTILKKDSPGSVAAYAHIVGHKNGIIGLRGAVYGSWLFREHTDEATYHPDRHGNIQTLLGIMREGHELYVEMMYAKEADPRT